MSGLVSCARKQNRSHLWMRGESRLHSITLAKVSHRLDSMQPVAFMLCCKHIPTSREQGNVLEAPVQTLPAAPKSQLIHCRKHHFKMGKTAGRQDVKRKVSDVFLSKIRTLYGTELRFGGTKTNFAEVKYFPILI